MKQIKTILLAMAFMIGLSLSAQAQVTDTVDLGSRDVKQCLAVAASGFDTIVDAGTIVYVVKVQGSKRTFTIQADVDKYSGTVGGTITVAGRVSTTQNFATIGSAYTVTDADQSKVFELDGADYSEIRITAAGASTMGARYNICVLSRN